MQSPFSLQGVVPVNLQSCFSIFLTLIVTAVYADTPDPPQTAISTPDRLIVFSSFAQDHPRARKQPLLDWKAGIGEWWVADGAVHGDELPQDKHASSLTHPVDATHLVICGEFRLGTAKHIAFACRDDIKPHHHLARTFISPNGIWITHMSGIAKTTKSKKIAELKTPVDPDAWHPITIEIIGDHYRVQIGNHVLDAKHSRFAAGKGIIALVTKGQGAQFRNIALWQAKPKKSE